jgi:predicted transcriptional regulator
MAHIQEPELKTFVTVDFLKQWLRSDLEQGTVFTGVEAAQNAFLSYEVIKEPSEFVAVVQDANRLLGVVDRLELSARIARTELARHINQTLKQAARA